MEKQLEIPECTKIGCGHYNKHSNNVCSLHGLPLEQFASIANYFKSSNVCSVRKQLNEFNTLQLLTK